MVLDHIGIVVPSLERAVLQWHELFGYSQLTEIVENTRQRVYVVFLVSEGSTPVKLIAPTGPDSPVHMLAQRGGGLHHLCFRAESLDAELARLRSLGVRLVTPPQPGEAFDGEDIAFVYAGNGLNIELIDTVKRAALLAR
jgi:methylmalonyl-CoA/ethylmalonyl-CoA epimerase